MLRTEYKEPNNDNNSSSLITEDLGAGNVVPNWWYKEIRAAGNKADLVAITILSELYYLYRKTNGAEFTDGYIYFERKFAFTRSQLKDAIIRLADADLVERSFRTVVVRGRNFSNELHLKLNLAKLIQLKSKYISNNYIADSDNDSDSGYSSNYTEAEPFSDQLDSNSFSYYKGISSEHISNRKISIRKNRSNESSFVKNSFRDLAQEEFNLASFYPLAQSDIELLQSKSNTKFTEVAVNEILLKLSKKYHTHKFPNKRAFFAYMAKVLRYEMRDAVKISGVDFKLNCNRDSKEYEQEAYLAQVEYSNDTSNLGQLKRKLAAVLNNKVAYELLNSISSAGKVANNDFILNVKKPVDLSPHQEELILSQVQAVYGPEVHSFSMNTLGSLASAPAKSSTNSLSIVGAKQTTIWSKVRSRLIDYFGVNGHDLDKAWFSQIEANIDNDNKTLSLKAPSSFVKDWITERYSHLIERFCRQDQYSLVLI